MAQENIQLPEELEGSYEKVQSYFNENKKSITIIGGAIIALVVAFFAYLKFYKEPREEAAQQALWKAQYYFEVDSFNLAINGNGLNPGLQQIVDDYSGTNAGNLATYYLGISYLNTGQYQLAIDYLSEFESDDQIISSIALGSTGDAYLELGNVEEAIDYYEEAYENNKNQFTTPLYMKKAALAHESLGDFKKAAELYESIQEDFEESTEARDIDKFLARAKNLSGN